MKTDIANLAVKLLSPEERAVLRRMSEQEVEVNAPMQDMEIRAGLCTSLADMSESMRGLLGLMARHNFITLLPDEAFPSYERLMDHISNTAAQASRMVECSRALDRELALKVLPESTSMCQ